MLGTVAAVILCSIELRLFVVPSAQYRMFLLSLLPFLLCLVDHGRGPWVFAPLFPSFPLAGGDWQLVMVFLGPSWGSVGPGGPWRGISRIGWGGH